MPAAFRKLLAPPFPRAIARVAGGVSAATGPGRTAGAPRATSGTACREARSPQGELLPPRQPRHGFGKDTKMHEERRREQRTDHHISGYPNSLQLTVARSAFHPRAGISSRFSCCRRTLSPAFPFPVTPPRAPRQRRALTS